MKNLLKSYFRTRTFALFVDITLQISEFRIAWELRNFESDDQEVPLKNNEKNSGLCYATVNFEFRKINRRKPIH